MSRWAVVFGNLFFALFASGCALSHGLNDPEPARRYCVKSRGCDGSCEALQLVMQRPRSGEGCLVVALQPAGPGAEMRPTPSAVDVALPPELLLQGVFWRPGRCADPGPLTFDGVEALEVTGAITPVSDDAVDVRLALTFPAGAPPVASFAADDVRVAPGLRFECFGP